MTDSAILLIHCPDSRGLVASVATFLFQHNANILHSDQHQDADQNRFFMRVEWDLKGFTLDLDEVRERFQPIARRFAMQWQLKSSRRRQRVAIFVSRQDHCLSDLLYRHSAGELPCDIPLIISNHEQARRLANYHGIPFNYLPISSDDKARVEARQLQLLEEHGIDLLVLARYMQILSGDFIARYPNRIINIHHSFLPAFLGAKPYWRAHQRGVKLIGATSHYVTDQLDDGPIIEQDIVRISHRDQVEDLVAKGKDIERVVLSRAVNWHLHHRILTYSNKTVIFD